MGEFDADEEAMMAVLLLFKYCEREVGLLLFEYISDEMLFAVSVNVGGVLVKS